MSGLLLVRPVPDLFKILDLEKLLWSQKVKDKATDNFCHLFEKMLFLAAGLSSECVLMGGW